MTYGSGKINKIWLGAALTVASVIIGVFAGVLKYLIKWLGTPVKAHFSDDSLNWWLIPLAVTAMMTVGWIVRNVVKMPLEHATQRLKNNLITGNGRMPLKLTVASLLTSAITLGFGGSAGSEGPIAYTGAAIGSNVARYFRLDKRSILVFMACGGGAGIAAIFKSPFGGMFFTIEVLRMQLGFAPVLMLASMCLISSLTASAISDFHYDLVLASNLQAFEWKMLLPLLLLGVCCGIYGAYYRVSGHFIARFVEGFSKPVLSNISSGLILGTLLFMFPVLYGEGYGALSAVAQGEMSTIWKGSIVSGIDSSVWLPVSGLAGVLLAKGMAASATNSGGGVAGEFAPTLFAGGMAGALFALFFPQGAVSGYMAIICGMAGAMAAIIRAPLMTIFLVVEMTNSTPLLLPVSAVAVTAMCVSRIIDR